jgi:hypothetical protein
MISFKLTQGLQIASTNNLSTITLLEAPHASIVTKHVQSKYQNYLNKNSLWCLEDFPQQNIPLQALQDGEEVFRNKVNPYHVANTTLKVHVHQIHVMGSKGYHNIFTKASNRAPKSKNLPNYQVFYLCAI